MLNKNDDIATPCLPRLATENGSDSSSCSIHRTLLIHIHT